MNSGLFYVVWAVYLIQPQHAQLASLVRSIHQHSLLSGGIQISLPSLGDFIDSRTK